MARIISMAGLDLTGIEWLPPRSPLVATEPAREVESKRSDLPCPRIILDRVEYKSTVTGEMITSRAQHRDHLRRHGMIELGNEQPKPVSKEIKRAKHKKDVAADLKTALDKYNQGYRAPKLDSAEKHGITVPTKGDTVRAHAPAPAFTL